MLSVTAKQRGSTFPLYRLWFITWRNMLMSQAARDQPNHWTGFWFSSFSLSLSLYDFLRMIDGHLVKRKGKGTASSSCTLHQWHLFVSWQQLERRHFFPFGLKLSVPLIASERGHKEGKLGFYLNRCMNCSDSHPDTPLLFLRLSAVFQREAFNLFKLWSPRAELSSSVCLCPSVCLYIFPSCHTQSFQVCVHAVELTEKAHCLPK